MDRRAPAGSRLVGSGSHVLAGYTTIMVTPTVIPSPTKITRIEVDERAATSYRLSVVRRWSRRWRLLLREHTTDLVHLRHVGRRVSLPATDCT
jgi:hypothetical protein